MKAVGATGLSAALALTSAFLPLSLQLTPRAPSRSKEALRAHPRRRLAYQPGLQKAEGQITVYVQFKGKGAYEQTQSAAVLAYRKEALANCQAQVHIAAQVRSRRLSLWRLLLVRS